MLKLDKKIGLKLELYVWYSLYIMTNQTKRVAILILFYSFEDRIFILHFVYNMWWCIFKKLQTKTFEISEFSWNFKFSSNRNRDCNQVLKPWYKEDINYPHRFCILKLSTLALPYPNISLILYFIWQFYSLLYRIICSCLCLHIIV